MHEPYDEDDGYHENEFDYDDNHYDPYKFYFKFDIGNTPISDWIQNMINDLIKDPFGINHIPGFPVKKFPVNSWNPNAGQSNSFQYLGSNYQGNPIWKYKHFISNKLNTYYIKHLQSHAVHFIQQPSYYKGMFDILN